MKTLISAATLWLLFNAPAAAQQHERCHFDAMRHQRMIEARKGMSKQELERRIADHIHTSRGGDESIRLLPVVVHVIHHGGAENISDEQVYSQFDVLNLDFRRLNEDAVNTNPVFVDVAADAGIEFCLATLDPEGNETNGIDRQFTNDTTWTSLELVEEYGWDTEKYMNIYISKTVGCFSSFPGDDPSEDGVFITHGRFGTTGTAGSELYAEFSKFGRTATHEVGHYLGLYHTFDIQCYTECEAADFVCDTPPANMRWWVAECMPQDMNTCWDDELPDQVDNYMDYNTDSCANMFSIGQKERMIATLDLFRSVLWSESNLIETGCAEASGIPEHLRPANVKLYPNPATDFTMLEFSNPRSADHTLYLYDMHGRLVYSDLHIRSGAVRINRERLVNGVYFYRLETGGEVRASGKVSFQ